MSTGFPPDQYHFTSRRTFIEKFGTCAVLFSLTPLVPVHKKYSMDPFQNIDDVEVQLPVKWIHGSIKCQENNDPPFQVHQVDQDTYILRQSKCITYEAPFLYLFIGEERAFLLDTGDRITSDVLQTMVESLLPYPNGNKNGKHFDLIVAHTHGHSDHTYGDSHFKRRPNTEIVPAGQNAVRTFFGIQDWPNDPVSVDLGGRMLTVIPIPGHTLDHIAVYDGRTHFLMTGDTLYPGNLYVRYWPGYRQSINRLADFASTHAVSYILGNHIEMSNKPGILYPIGSTYQPEEHVLQLNVKHLEELRDACNAMGTAARHDVHDDFIIVPRG